MRTCNGEHAQNNLQGQRQSQKDYQPKRYLLPEAGALGMRFFAGAFNQSNTLNKSLKPRPVTAGEAAVPRPHHGQNRQADCENRRERGVHHYQITGNMLAKDKRRIESGQRQHDKAKQRQQINKFP